MKVAGTSRRRLAWSGSSLTTLVACQDIVTQTVAAAPVALTHVDCAWKKILSQLAAHVEVPDSVDHN